MESMEKENQLTFNNKSKEHIVNVQTNNNTQPESEGGKVGFTDTKITSSQVSKKGSFHSEQKPKK